MARYFGGRTDGAGHAMADLATPVDAETAPARAELARRLPVGVSGITAFARRLFGSRQPA
jgi:hypothetical protein